MACMYAFSSVITTMFYKINWEYRVLVAREKHRFQSFLPKYWPHKVYISYKFVYVYPKKYLRNKLKRHMGKPIELKALESA